VRWGFEGFWGHAVPHLTRFAALTTLSSGEERVTPCSKAGFPGIEVFSLSSWEERAGVRWGSEGCRGHVASRLAQNERVFDDLVETR
jgi:hypothetical protein